MENITIDRDKCIGCGECAADCVGRHIALKDGKAYVIVIGARQDFEVYRQAEKRLADYREWLSKNGERA